MLTNVKVLTFLLQWRRCRISSPSVSTNGIWMGYEWNEKMIEYGLTPSGRVAGNSSIIFHGHLHIGNIIFCCLLLGIVQQAMFEYQRLQFRKSQFNLDSREHDDKHWNFEAFIFRLLPRSRQLKQLQMGISPGSKWKFFTGNTYPWILP